MSGSLITSDKYLSHGYKKSDQSTPGDIAKPLTRAEAQAFRKQHKTLSPWEVLVWQAAAGVIIAAIAWAVTGLVSVAWSVLYGALAVVVPAAMFARGLSSRVLSINPAAAVTGFFLWEMMKIGLVLAMLFAAPKLISNLSWPAMLVGLVGTMKVVWLTLWFESKHSSSRNGFRENQHQLNKER